MATIQDIDTKTMEMHMKNWHITHKMLKSQSTSEWATIMKIVNKNENEIRKNIFINENEVILDFNKNAL